MMIATRFFGIENLVLKEEKKLSKMFLRLLVYIYYYNLCLFFISAYVTPCLPLSILERF